MVLALFCNSARTTPFPFSRATHSANALRRADPAFLPSSVPFHAPPARSKMAASTTWFVRPSMPNKCELRPAFRSTPLPPPPAQPTLVLAKRGKHHISFLVFFCGWQVENHPGGNGQPSSSCRFFAPAHRAPRPSHGQSTLSHVRGPSVARSRVL